MSKKPAWALKTISIDQLKEWDQNPRKISREDLDNLKQSFQEYGHARTLTVSPLGKGFEIIGGNQSLKCLRELEVKEVACSVASRPLTETEKRKLSIYLNHRGKGEGEWEWPVLEQWSDVNFEEIGIDIIDESEPVKMKIIDLKPYNKTHILISYHPELHDKINDAIEGIINIDGIEIERSSN
ncbi:MAG: ParB N-terminal domain-containing protein [Bacteroidales bacterium]|jgi:hypothetical protein